MNEHVISYNTPGTTWNPSIKGLLINAHTTLGHNLFSQVHYHLYVKYAYAKAFIEKDKSLSLWTHLYDKMQQKRIGTSKRQEFNQLINSILEYGFLKEFPIPIDSELGILDGSHRLAAVHACKIEPLVEVYRNSSHEYNRTWFKSVGFNSFELRAIDQVKNSFPHVQNTQSRVAIIWGSAFNFWEEIFSILKEKELIFAHWISFENIHAMKNFVVETYEDDGMNMDNIYNKALRLAEISTIAAIVVFKNTLSEEELRKIKLGIRDAISYKMKDYFFDSIIHVVDSQKTSQSLVTKYVRF